MPIDERHPTEDDQAAIDGHWYPTTATAHGRVPMSNGFDPDARADSGLA